MAYVDGEVDSDTRQAVAAAAASDAGLAARIARHAALRESVRTAYDATLNEPVPERLRTMLSRGSATASTSRTTDLAQARTAQQQRVPRPRFRPEMLAIAASVAVGIAIGLLLGYGGVGPRRADLVAFENGLPTATGRLAQVLSTRLASESEGDGAVRLGVSFRAKSGEFCRSFTLPAPEGLSGLACRQRGAWRVLSLEQRPGLSSATHDYRMAGSGAARASIAAIEELIDGEPLDAKGEKAALEQGWR